MYSIHDKNTKHFSFEFKVMQRLELRHLAARQAFLTTDSSSPQMNLDEILLLKSVLQKKSAQGLGYTFNRIL